MSYYDTSTVLLVIAIVAGILFIKFPPRGQHVDTTATLSE